MAIYNYNEVKTKFKNDYNIKVQISRKKLFKIHKGIYSDTKNYHELSPILKKYPGCIITLESAYYYYELSTVKPEIISIGTRRNFTRIKFPNTKQYFYSDTTLDKNATHYIKDNLEINIFSRERLLVELIRNKNKFSQTYYDEVFHNYLKISDSLDTSLILKYAQMYKIKEAEEFANKYIHEINDYDYDDFDDYISGCLSGDKDKVYLYGSKYLMFTKKCECCNSYTISALQKVCYMCGWWEKQNSSNSEKDLLLNDYKTKYLRTISENSDYVWSENINRINPVKKIIKKTIIDEPKISCGCCGKLSLKKWYDQCNHCGWIADYIQEEDRYTCRGANQYSLYDYKSNYLCL